MRRWTVIRTGGLAIAAVVAIGALYQVPASPFSRRVYPDHEKVDPGSSIDPSTVPRHSPILPPAPPPKPPITYSVAGTRSYAVLSGSPVVIGRAGPLMTYQLAIERGITGIDPLELAQFVRATYGAPQGWASQGQWRFQQVGPRQVPDFTLMLVTPATRDAICGSAPDRYTSCRIGDQVVLNVARWVHGIPHYRAALTTYRQYMINHETGHRLGRGHELCPGPGQPAPVMQQQTLGLHGCTAYAWPHLNGKRYSGRLGQYDDRVPVTPE